jgi:peptidoglycan L-alanyl-D-glutamate endopeptidase CwlK
MSRSIDNLEASTKLMVQNALQECRSQGLDLLITQTYRSWEEQALEYAKGRTAPGRIVTNAKPGQSWHQWGRAIDIVPRRNNGKTLVWGTRGNGLDQDPSDDDTDDLELWQRIAACFKMHGLKWAGDWTRFKEFPHFENTGGMTTRMLMEKYPRGLKPGSFV